MDTTSYTSVSSEMITSELVTESTGLVNDEYDTISAQSYAPSLPSVLAFDTAQPQGPIFSRLSMENFDLPILHINLASSQVHEVNAAF
jgi:hypothetical protein